MKRLLIFGMAVFFLTSSMAMAQKADDAKEKEKEAKQKLADFQKAFPKATTDDDRTAAIRTLAEVQHPKILEMLRKLLVGFTPAVNAAAAEELSKYTKNQEAATALMQAIKGSNKDKEMMKTFFKALGQVRFHGAAKFLQGYFQFPDTEVASAAFDAAATIRSRELIEPMIMILLELEQKDLMFKQKPMPPFDPNKKPTPEELAAQAAEDLEKRRVAALLPVVNTALGSITKQNHPNGSEWAAWWKKNKATFKVED